ncbi:MAG: TadE/TadG family type IV pilus assembly protein [Aestuariivirga sp.]
MKARGEMQGLSERLACLLRSTAGSIAVSAAVASPILLAASGLAIDFVTLQMKRGELQAAADVSALGGAKELALAGSSDQAIKSVVAAYIATEFSGSKSTVTSTAEIDRKAGTLRVEVQEAWTPAFAQFLNAAITPIKVDATASLVGTANICVLALDSAGTKAIHLDKIAKLQANDCAVYSNSTDAQGIRLDLDSSIAASLVCSAGGVKARTTAVKPMPTTDCPAIPDPLASRATPIPGSCDQSGLIIASGNRNLAPGTYCGGLQIKGTATVTFAPGTYIIKNGKFLVANTAKITGQHVGFYLLGNASVIDFKDQASISLTGAIDGDMAGLLFFEDRAAPINRQHHIQSTKVTELTGTIYLPRGYLQVDPNTSVAGDSAYTAIIARRLEMSEGPELILNSDYGSTDVPVPPGIRSSAEVVLSE